ncbi:hypothetical protein [Saccharolobus islandicus]|uniref:hypothetical protein n=1 Tax=Saccharolobus islandicus TaxID=43080 RepID=UPI003D7E1117
MKLYFLSIIPISMGLLLAYLFPYNQLLPITIFWIFLIYLLFRTIFRGELSAIKEFRSNVKWGIFSSYIVVHYLLYSIAIEALLSYLYKPLVYPQPFSISVFTTPFINSNLVNLGLSLLFNPTITVFIPPNLIVDLSLYSISLGLLISILVTSSLAIILSLNRKLKYITLVPLIGLITGAGCCISIPVLLANALELSNLIFLTTPAWQIIFIAYVSLPILTVIFLKHLSNSLIKLKNKIN